MSLTSIQEEIARLSSTERAMLIDILWESLDEADVKEIEAKWAAESEERIDAVDRRITDDRWPYRPARASLVSQEMTHLRDGQPTKQVTLSTLCPEPAKQVVA